MVVGSSKEGEGESDAAAGARVAKEFVKCQSFFPCHLRVCVPAGGSSGFRNTSAKLPPAGV